MTKIRGFMVGLLLLLNHGNVFAQNTYTWNGDSPAVGDWMTPGLWRQGHQLAPSAVYAGVAAPMGAGNANDIARFGGFNGSPYGTVGLDLDAVGASGLQLGAVTVVGTNNLVLQNSSATANLGARQLRLNGATVGNLAGLPTNTILAAINGNITIQPGVTAVNNPGLGVQLGLTNGQILVNSGRTITINSVISESSSGQAFTLRGGGTLNLTAANSFTGTTTLRGAGTTLNLQGTDGRLNGPVEVGTSARLNVNNSSTANANRLANSAGITLRGGALTLSGNSSSNITENIGTLTVGAGFSEVRVTTAGSSTTILQGTNLARSDSGILYVSANTSANNRIQFTTSPTLTNSALPYVIVEETATPGQTTRFATYGSNGIQSGTTTGSWGSSNNVRLTATFNPAIPGTFDANTLQIETWDIAGGLVTGSNTINVGTGAILVSSTSGSRSYVMGPGSGDFSNPTNNRVVTVNFGNQPAMLTLISSTDYYTTGGGREYILNATFGNISTAANGGLHLSGLDGNIFRLNNTDNPYSNLTINGLAAGNYANNPDKPFAVNFNNNSNLGSGSNGVTLNRGFLVLRNRRQDIADVAISVTVNRTLTLQGHDRQGLGVGAAGSVLTWSGQMTGPGALHKIGPGTLIVSNASNNYQGDTHIEAGTLRLSGGNDRLPVSTQVVLGRAANSGVLSLNGNNQEVAGLTISGTGSGNRVVGGSATASTLTVNLNGGTQTFAGILGGTATNDNNLNLTKTGIGTFILTGTNTYTGTTNVTAGKLLINGNNSAASGNVTASGTGTLGGTGTIGGSVAVQSGATLQPGSEATTGTLTLANGLDLQSGSTWVVRITDGSTPGTNGGSTIGTLPNPTSNNFLNITGGTTTISSGTIVTLELTGVAFSTLWLPFSYQIASGAGDQSALNITDQSQFTAIGFTVQDFSLTGNASGAIFLNFTPIPEPSLMLLSSALVVAAGMAWRRRAQRQPI